VPCTGERRKEITMESFLAPEWPGGRLVVGEENAEKGRARVIGSLNSDAVEVLLDAVDSGVAVLDLSELHPIDASAIRVLAGLWPTHCTLVGCPPGLERRLAHVRCNYADF
jgi:hypothetical protein